MTGGSLRGRLFVLIVIPLIFIAGLAAMARYVMAERTSQRLYDNTLLAVALTISRDVVLSEGDMLTRQLLVALSNALGDPVYYRVEGPEGRFVTGYSNTPPMPARTATGSGVPLFYDAVSLGKAVRVVTLREFIAEPQYGGWVTVTVWQTINQRKALSLGLLVQSIVMMAIVVTAAALLVWFGINLGLRPLLRLRDAVALRSPDDLAPIMQAVPKEVRDLVGAMNSLFARLSTAFAVRDAFISDAAHQLRNPVAAIQAQAEAATTARSERELRGRVDELVDTARRTGRLTQQLLSMEKARGRDVAENRQTVDIGALVEDLAMRFAERELPRDVSASFRVSGDEYPISGDPIMLSEAIENMLDNASRYGCPNGGEVGIELEFNERQAVIRVSDSGQGIPAEVRERVFDRFFRISDDASGGCGLGLAIVRKVAEAHGGSARVVGSAGGATVEMLIPVDRKKPGAG